MLGGLFLLPLFGLGNHRILHNGTCFFTDRKVISKESVMLIVNINMTFGPLHHDFSRQFEAALFFISGELGRGLKILPLNGSNNLLGNLLLLFLF
jgi:hypothetical protein